MRATTTKRLISEGRQSSPDGLPFFGQTTPAVPEEGAGKGVEAIYAFELGKSGAGAKSIMRRSQPEPPNCLYFDRCAAVIRVFTATKGSPEGSRGFLPAPGARCRSFICASAIRAF